MGKFLDELRQSLSFLTEEKKFLLIEETYEHEHFGNGIIVLESQDFRIKFVKDRDQFFSDVQALSGDNTWWALYDICELLGIPDTFTHDLNNFALQVQIIQSQYAQISLVFSKGNVDKTETRLRTIVERRVRGLEESLRKKPSH